MKKKKEDEKEKRYMIIDVDNIDDEEDCMICFCHRTIDTDIVPEDILDRLDPEYIKPRLGFDIEKKRIMITTVLNLCDCSEGEVDEDSETVKIGDVTLILP